MQAAAAASSSERPTAVHRGLERRPNQREVSSRNGIPACLLTFRSVLGTVLVFVPLALVSILVYAVMAMVGIGLKVNTLPMVALGAGIGVDYGIYLSSRMQEYLRAGDTVHQAFEKTMRVTGASIIFTGITLAIGVITWVFSPLQFQADIGIMLTFMFFVNMLGAIILLPALAAWLVKPKTPPDRRDDTPAHDGPALDAADR
jgi:predicted RND superfamily exporter protein